MPLKSIALWNNGPTVSRLSLGCWPMAGITSLGVNDPQSLQTVCKAIELGINFFDTAYSYGYDGRSDRILSEAIKHRRDQVVIAHKVGQHWNERKERIVDGRPKTLLRHAKECLDRLKSDYIDLMYLHCPDPAVPLRESAQAIAEICQRGWAKRAGVCNVSPEQAAEFIKHCPTVAIQTAFNILQQESHRALRSIAAQCEIKLVSYWVFMKGLLSGHIRRTTVLAQDDRRRAYEIFQGKSWDRAHDLIDSLETIAREKGCTIGQLVIAWTLSQPNSDIVLLGAKTPEQIKEVAGSDPVSITPEESNRIEAFLSEGQT